MKKVPELLNIEETPDGLSIGGAVSLTRCLEVLATRLPVITSLLLRYGSEQIRNSGTIGGNIANASPIGDFPPVLIAVNATVTLGNGVSSRTVSVEDFFKSYKVTDLQSDEWVQSVFIPSLAEDAKFFVHKISKRMDDDISAVCGAFYWNEVDGELQNIRMAFGGMAAIPKRASKCEAVLNNKAWSEALLIEAQQAIETDFQPIDDARASALYRMNIAKNLLRRVWLDSSSAQPTTQVQDYVHG